MSVEVITIAQGEQRQQVLNLPKGAPGCDHTFSTIALYKRAFFADCGLPTGNPHGVALALAPLLRAAMNRGQVTGEGYEGAWTDVGTPERLAQLNHGQDISRSRFSLEPAPARERV